jgi:hypothetical protein
VDFNPTTITVQSCDGLFMPFFSLCLTNRKNERQVNGMDASGDTVPHPTAQSGNPAQASGPAGLI